MMSEFKNFLAISVDTLEPITEAVEQSGGNDYTVWIIVAVVVAVAAAAALLAIWFKPIKKICKAKAKRKEKKEKKLRDLELERLHEIKRKNKRK